MERYLAEGGHPGYDGDVALQLGKAFYELGDVPDARRAWWLGEKAVNAHTSLTPLIDRALYSATRHRVAEALQQLAEGYGAELSQVRFITLTAALPRRVYAWRFWRWRATTARMRFGSC